MLDGPEVSMGFLLEPKRMIQMKKNAVFSHLVSLSILFFLYKGCISFNAGKQDYLYLFIVYVLPLFFFPYPLVQRIRTINRKRDTEEECCFYLATSVIPMCCN